MPKQTSLRILYLYAELMGYTEATIRALITHGAEVLAIHWDHKKLTPYKPDPSINFRLIPRSELDCPRLTLIANDFSPHIVVVSGWMDKLYLRLARKLFKRGVPVVCGMDTAWAGTRKQLVAVAGNAASRLLRLDMRSFFSHAWVCGPDQYTYARLLGFSQQQIITDLYSADLEVFSQHPSTLKTSLPLPKKTITYCGRFATAKGLSLLITAWNNLPEVITADWTLQLIGEGPLKETLELTLPPNVITVPFLKPPDLAIALRESAALVLPSHREPWGVVVHEAAASGCALILSDSVHSRRSFLIDNANGLCFRTGDPRSLSAALETFTQLPEVKRQSMRTASTKLAMRITPDTSATNLLSILR